MGTTVPNTQDLRPMEKSQSHFPIMGQSQEGWQSFSWNFECKSGSQQCVLKQTIAASSSSLGCLRPETAHIQRLPTELVAPLSVWYIKTILMFWVAGIAHLT